MEQTVEEQVVEKKKYMLNIKMPFEAIDDADARQIVKDYLEGKKDLQKDIKFQKLIQGKPPEGMSL